MQVKCVSVKDYERSYIVQFSIINGKETTVINISKAGKCPYQEGNTYNFEMPS